MESNYEKGRTQEELANEDYFEGNRYYFGYNYRNYVVKQNYKKAIELYEKAASLGHIGAMYMLGRMYLYGIGCSQDYQTAKEWLEAAAEKGHDDAMCKL